MKLGKYEVTLIDDGTLDTVIAVNGIEFRFNEDNVRDNDGTLSHEGFLYLAEQAIEAYEIDTVIE